MHLELSTAEAVLLREICAEALAELRTEIADTDNFEFRQSLKSRAASLNELLGRLAAAA